MLHKIENINITNLLKRTDIAFAMGLVFVIAILIMPMPKIIMDFLLAMSITFSVIILMTSLLIEKPLDFSSFPTILLVSTMIRLSLNVASTRLILSHGHEGSKAAGRVIEAFGHFVMGGNFVIGIIVFSILVIINFVVITKGSGRIAEVSARFSLDAMPGKQMAIDADLSSGILDEKEAKRKRKDLELESNFYGAMDGAAKFVRGDAIAGVLITLINVIGGIIIGMAQNGLDIATATKSYTLLSVGDGLVAQIPSLIVSTAAGLLVSKSGVEGTADKAIFDQIGAYPLVLGMSSFLTFCLSLIPGLPILPFLFLSLVTGIGAWYLNNPKDLAQIESEAPKKTFENINAQHPIDLVRIELGYGLISYLNDEGIFIDKIKNLRNQIKQELGVTLPSIKLQDNFNLSNFEYIIKIKEIEVAKGETRPDQLLALDPKGMPFSIKGEHTIEPSFGLPALWIEQSQKLEAEELGLTVIDPVIVLMTHLSEIVKDNITDLLTYKDVQNLLDNVDPSYKRLINDMIPSQLNIANVQKILHNLVSERVSIRDFTTILEGMYEASSFSRSITTITEHIRQRLSRQISSTVVDDDGMVPIFTLSSFWEDQFILSLEGETDQKQLAMAPSKVQEFVQKVKSLYEKTLTTSPVLICSSMTRPYIRSILEKTRPSTIVLSHAELHPKIKTRNFGSI